jgi:cytoskeletal protein CcmA (bactofilin family)
MARTQGNDIQIAGGGSLDGGTYGAVTVNGVGTIRGDVTCDRLTINGAATATGGITANTIEVNGTARIDGVVQAQSLTVSGETTLARGAGIGTVVARGRLGVYGDLNARSVDVKGNLNVTGAVTGDSVTIEGIVRAERIAASTVEIGLHGPSTVSEIEARKVTVSKGTGWAGLSVMTILGERRLTATSIAANDVSIELTTANSVRAGDVRLGDGCRVGLVAHTGRLEQLPGALVTTVTKVEAP